jgi:glutamate carboxypeptidase
VRKSRHSLIALVALLCWHAQAQAQLDATERQMSAFIDSTNADAETLLIETININSGSMNLEGVREVGRILAAQFEAIDFETRWVDGSAFNRATFDCRISW